MKKYLALFSIVCIGAFLRFYQITTIPPSLSHDETAIAYNAYSILKTGKDEYGKQFPLLLRSFDDYKLPGMVYSTIPFVALFGKSELAARLPSAIYGILSIIVLYFLVFELTGSLLVSRLSSLALALQPWHINFSRQLFESNGAVFWFMLGTYALLRSLKKYNALLWAGLCYVIALYFYYSVRLVIPFVALVYLITQWKNVWKKWNITLFTLVICIAAFFPMAREMLSPGGLERISIVSVVNDPNYIKRRDEYFQKFGPGFHRLALAQTIIENYWKNIAPHNLFVTGTGTYGALYPFEIFLILIGIISLFSLPRFSILITLTWLFTAFLPGAFSINQPNTLRTLIAAPVFAILSGLGLKNRLIMILTCLALLVSFPKFYHAYFVDNPTNNALSFADGTKQMVSYVKEHEQSYDRIYISGYYWRPYIFMLYWGNSDPNDFQKTGNREQFGTYYFSASSWDTNGMKFMDPAFDFASLPHTGKTLFILSYSEFDLHQQYFTKIADISGRNTPQVFISAQLKP